MKRDILIETIYKAEQELPLHNWKLGEIHFWPILKRDLVMQIINDEENIKPDKEISKNLFKKIYCGIIEWCRIKSVKSKEYFFLSNKAYFRERIEKVSYNKHFDPILDELSQGTIIQEIDKINQGDYYKKNRILFTGDYFYLREFVFSRFKRFYKKPKVDNSILVKIYEIFDASGFGISAKKILKSDLLINRWLFINNYKKFYIKLFNALKTKTVVLLCYYSGNETFGATIAATKLGIKCYDLQHGPVNSQHPLYTGYTNAPIHGYNSIPKKFLCWSKNDIENVNLYNRSEFVKNHNALYFGHPWISFVNRLQIDVSLPKNIALFSAQPLSEPFNEELFELIQETQNKYSWFIRLHPRQLNDLEKYNSLLQKKYTNFNIIDASKLPLPVILSNTILHVTRFSGVAIEASLFKIPTIFIDDRGVEGNKQLIENGYAFNYKDIDLRNIPAKEDLFETSTIDISAIM